MVVDGPGSGTGVQKLGIRCAAGPGQSHVLMRARTQSGMRLWNRSADLQTEKNPDLVDLGIVSHFQGMAVIVSRNVPEDSIVFCADGKMHRLAVTS